MKARFRPWLWQWLIAIDQLAHVGVCFWTFVVLDRGPCPVADETISSRVGRAASKGHRWAIAAEACIDWLFLRLCGQAKHCRSHIEWDEVPQET